MCPRVLSNKFYSKILMIIIITLSVNVAINEISSSSYLLKDFIHYNGLKDSDTETDAHDQMPLHGNS